MSYRVKQVIVVRSDLGMRKGKMIAQGAHASLKVFLDRAVLGGSIDENPHREVLVLQNLTSEMMEWVEGSFAKVCVRATSEEQLLELHAQAEKAGIPCALIKDSGKTEFHGVATYTALAIGPANREDIDLITGSLKLL
jgi:PTH2 family peptidyl-tRNA hydrolase